MPPNATPSHLNDTLAATNHYHSKQNLNTMKASGGPSDMTPLPDDFTPGEKDVVCSWARQNHRHGGNIRFRKLVDEHAPAYVKAETKYEKTKVIADLIDRVRQDSPDGGFVKRDFYSGRWYEIGIERARDKVGHAIRKAADKLTSQQLEQGQGKQSKGGQAAAVIKKLKTKNTARLDSIDSEGQDDGKGSFHIPPRGSVVGCQNLPTTLTPGAGSMPSTAQNPGIGASLDTQNQQVNFSFPRHHLPDSFQFQHHHGPLGGFLNAPISEGRSALRAPSSSFHPSNRQFMGGLFSWTNNVLHASDNETILGGGLPSAHPYLAQPPRRKTSASGSMLPPHQHPDFTSYHSGFVGTAVVADTHMFPSTPGTGNESLSAALPIPLGYADQHLPYRRSLAPGSMSESTRDASFMSRSTFNRGGRSSLLADNPDIWDQAHPYHSDYQRQGTTNSHPSDERSNMYDTGGGERFNSERYS